MATESFFFSNPFWVLTWNAVSHRFYKVAVNETVVWFQVGSIRLQFVSLYSKPYSCHFNFVSSLFSWPNFFEVSTVYVFQTCINRVNREILFFFGCANERWLASNRFTNCGFRCIKLTWTLVGILMENLNILCKTCTIIMIFTSSYRFDIYHVKLIHYLVCLLWCAEQLCDGMIFNHDLPKCVDCWVNTS